jgi:succinate dehydrogenase / fumarate reductase membrane anchor subunit
MEEASNKSLRTPLRRIRHLGAARSGTQQFWHQRLTAVADIPLTIAAVAIVIVLFGRNHAAVVKILGSPFVAIVMLLFIFTSIYHMWIGMQEIIADYVHDERLKFMMLMANTFFSFAVGLSAAYAIFTMSFGV